MKMGYMKTISNRLTGNSDTSSLMKGFTVNRLDHFVITVKDVAKTTEFYSRVLGMIVKNSSNGIKELHFGDQKINVHDVGGGLYPKPKRPTPGSTDVCFNTDTNLNEVIKHLKNCNVPVIAGPMSVPGARGRMTSVYFLDPDDNLIEVANYSK
ncbi:glyoxalase domain-containing protein 5-like [Gigantopelta aegis]|uniref:glyoxalase domain-containing protein 5-like n=1 Tax=Gigantopelta aegis TaxID=1735272 RepID=UPI001B88A8FB|nr:glyoxalase domain-containing protein 5-like [Gigantopelta aegis]